MYPFYCIRMYIHCTLSCCICHVFHLVFSVYVHLMYIFLSLFSVDGFYCAILLDIVLICCCTPDNDVESPSPDMGRHTNPGSTEEIWTHSDKERRRRAGTNTNTDWMESLY